MRVTRVAQRLPVREREPLRLRRQRVTVGASPSPATIVPQRGARPPVAPRNGNCARRVAPGGRAPRESGIGEGDAHGPRPAPITVPNSVDGRETYPLDPARLVSWRVIVPVRHLSRDTGLRGQLSKRRPERRASPGVGILSRAPADSCLLFNGTAAV